MNYIKYFEGFTDGRLKDLILNDETYVKKINRIQNNKELKYSQEINN